MTLRTPRAEPPQNARSCCVCGSSSQTAIFRQTFAPFEAALTDGYSVVACAACGFCFADPAPRQDALDAYYRDLSKYEHPLGDSRPDPLETARHERTVEILRPWIPSPRSRILDIGCSTGALLDLLSRAGFPDVQGWDPSPRCAALARQLYGIDVSARTLADGGDPGGPFDLIVLIGVLEHVRDLHAALGRLEGALAPGGLLYLDVPDAAHFHEWVDAPYQQFSAEHINFFSAASLGGLLGSRRFEALWLRHDVHQLTERSSMPAVRALFRRKAAPDRHSLEHDTASERALHEYVLRSSEWEARILPAVNTLAETRQPVLLWGAGTLARRLLAVSRLREANLAGIIDSNPRYHGKLLAGRPVLAPAAVAGRNEPILIASLGSEQEIERQVRDTLGGGNPILRLPGPDADATVGRGPSGPEARTE